MLWCHLAVYIADLCMGLIIWPGPACSLFRLAWTV